MKFKGVEQKDVLEVLYHPTLKHVVGFKIGGRLLKEDEVDNFQAQALVINNSELWGLLSDRTVYTAQIRAVDNAKSFEDVLDSRGAVRAVGIFNATLQALISYKKADKPKQTTPQKL